MAGSPRSRERLNIWQRASEASFDRLRRGYDRSLGWALRHAPLVICLLLGVIALNVELYIAAPKASCPTRTPGRLAASFAATTVCRSR